MAAMGAGTPDETDVATDCLFMAGGRIDGDLLTLLGRLDLCRSADRESDAGPLTASWAGTAMLVHSGTAALQRYQAMASAPAQSIGGAAMDPPDARSLLAIELAPTPNTSREAHVASVQHLCIAALAIGSAIGAGRLFWPPARLWSPFAPFADAVAALQDQGLPPILHLVAMVSRSASRIQTGGLAHFCGIELALDHPDDLPQVEAVRRLARLAIHAMVAGPMQRGAGVAGLAPDETLWFGAVEPGDPPVVPVKLRRREP